MRTFLTYFLGLLVVGGLLFVVASFVFGRGEELAPIPPDVTPVALPDERPVTGRDVRKLRISVVLRGYRMHEVDWILDQLADQLDDRDREILRLRDERDEAMMAIIHGRPDEEDAGEAAGTAAPGDRGAPAAEPGGAGDERG